MRGSIPRALIYGIDHFAAGKLAKKLLDQEIEVLGIGEDFLKIEDKENFQFKMELGEEDVDFNYIFDFVGDNKVWEKAKEEQSKLTIISVNDRTLANRVEKESRHLDCNWRLVESYGVYGPQMPEEGFLFEAIEKAIQNKNLTLPSLDLVYRILNVEDLVEAVLRANFLSGTDKERFLVLGEETNSEEMAAVLIDEAKMTTNKVIQEDIKIDSWRKTEVLENWEKLRWKPEVNFKEGIKETLQYFFSKMDEESRKKKPVEIPKKNWEVAVEPILKKKEKRFLEVMVEEEKPKEELKEIEIEVKKKPETRKESKLSKIEIVEDDEIEVEDEKEEENKIPLNLPLTRETLKISKIVNNRPKYGLIFFLSLLVILILMPINWMGVGFFSYKNIFAAEKLIQQKKYSQADITTKKSLKKVQNLDLKIDDWGLNRFALMRNYQTVLKTMEDVFILENKAIELAKNGEEINGAIFNGRQINWNSNLERLKTELTDIESQIGILQARLKGNWKWLPGRWEDLPLKISKQLDETKLIVDLSNKATNVLPEFLGLDGKRREYLVLLQNENELRPTGGFIGSYAILSFEKGKLINFEIKDVYEADGQLKGHVEPPEEIKNYLGEAGWFMRDANWNADFSQTSKDLQWFLEKETGRKVDGVIGLNLEVIKTILETTGEVFVPDFNEKINKDNLYEQAEFYAETKFFPGSTQKASFLGGLGKQLFEEVRNLKTDKMALLYKGIINLLGKNEIQVYLNQKKGEETLSNLGWSGTLYKGKCNSDKCYADYLFLVEANFGVNKANYFLYRNIEQSINISNNSVDRVLKINYENTAKSTAWPGGDYKNYLRIYLPTNIILGQVSLVDANDPNSKKIYNSSEIKIMDVNDKREVGLLLTVPVNSKRILQIQYSSPINLDGKNTFSYLNYIQKQSGFGNTGLVTLVSFPKDFQPTQVQPEASLVGGKLLFNQKLDGNIKMGVELGK
jgi:hypothetical protein